MKSHAGLVRAILERLEAQPGTWGTIRLPADVQYSIETVDYHLVLCQQAGFIIHGGEPRNGCYQLTWEGHQHLAKLRAESQPGEGVLSSPARRRRVSQRSSGDPLDVGRFDADGDDGD